LEIDGIAANLKHCGHCKAEINMELTGQLLRCGDAGIYVHSFCSRPDCYEGKTFMRLIFGIIIGVLLTIGGAYVHDSASEPRIVNWDVADRNFQDIASSLHDGWARLVAAIDRLKT
jgi:hypothetical protein